MKRKNSGYGNRATGKTATPATRRADRHADALPGDVLLLLTGGFRDGARPKGS